MGFVMNLLALVDAFSKDKRVRQGRPTGNDMDRASSCKVQRWEIIEPSIGIPGPACDWTIHNGSPAESEDHRRHDTSSFECTANHDHDSTGTEKHLVEAEDDFWKEDGAGRRGAHDVFHAEVVEVANEGVSVTGVGKRISPEHPLEADTDVRQ